MANKKIKEFAHQKAYEQSFCNVGEDDWPDDPEAFIADLLEDNPAAQGIDLLFKNQNGKCMEIWEPFERYSVDGIDGIVELMYNYEAGLIAFYWEAKKMEE